MDAPEHLDDATRAVWEEVVDAHPKPATLSPIELEAFCSQVALLRDAQSRVSEEGVLVANEKGVVVPHPALAVARAAQDEVRRWGSKFAPRRSTPRRKPGAMYSATRRSVAAAEHLRDRAEFEGAIEAACTLAWLIDEAQREGLEAVQKTAFGAIPAYLKACAALQITPADVPVVGEAPAAGGGRLAALTALQGGMTGAAGA